MIQTRVATRLYLLIAVLSAVVTAISIARGFLIAAGDATIPELAPHVAFSHLSSTWGAAAGIGRDASFYRPLLFPLIAVDSAFSELGFSDTFINHFWLYAIVIGQSCFTLRLILRIFPSLRFAPAIFFGAVASVFNPFMLMQMHSIFISSLLSLAAFPALVCAGIAYVEERRAKYLFEFLLWAFVCAVAVNFSIPALEGAVLWTALLLTACALRAGAFARLIPLALIYAGAMTVWTVPSYHWARIIGPDLIRETLKYSADTIRVTSTYSHLPNAARLIGQYLFFNDIGGKPFVAEGQSYITQWWLIAATSVLPGLALLALLLAWRKGKRVWAIGAIALVALFMAKGAAPPGGAVFEWLFTHVPAFSAFRNSFDKFAWIVAYAYALLGAYALNEIAYLVGRRIRWALTAVCVAALLLGVYPFFLGHMFWSQSVIRIPPSYYALARWIDDRGGRSLQLPVAPAAFDTYEWGYVGSGILFNLIEPPLLSRVYDLASPGNAALNDVFQNYDSTVGDQQAAYLLGLYNFRNVIYDSAIRLDYFGPFYSAAPDLPLPRTHSGPRFGSARVDTIDEKLLNAAIYAPNRVITGASTLAEVGYTCHAISTCRGTAFMSRPAVDGVPGGVPYTSVKFGPVAAKRASPTPVAELGRAADIADAQWTPAQEISNNAGRWHLPMPLHASEMAFADFADRSIASNNFHQVERHLMTLAGHPPLILAIPTGSNPSHDFRTIFQTKTVAVCAETGSTNIREINLASNLDWRSVLLLAFAYESSGVELSVRLLDPQAPQIGSDLTLDPSGGRTLAFTRFLAVGRDTGRLTLQVIARATARGGCAELRDVTFARAVDASRWRLGGGRGNFHLTPPYFAAYPRAIGDGLNRFIRPVPADRTRTMNDGAPIIAAWSAPVVVAGVAEPVVGKIPRQDKRQELFRSYGASAALIANFAHLVPSGKYELTFKLSHVRGPRPYVSIITNGIAIASYNPEQNGKISSYTFTMPGNATDLSVYLYYGSNEREYASGAVTNPALKLVNASTRVLSMSFGKQLERPRTLTVEWSSPGRADLRVGDAPHRYVLVFDSAYSPDWQLETPAGMSATHVKANLYVNAWVLQNARGSYVLHLHYRNDDIAQQAALAGALLIALGLLHGVAQRRQSSIIEES